MNEALLLAHIARMEAALQQLEAELGRLRDENERLKKPQTETEEEVSGSGV